MTRLLSKLLLTGLLTLSAGTGIAEEPELSFIERFKSKDTQNWHVAEYDFNHPAFDTDWRKSQVLTGDGLSLALRPQSSGKNRFVGGSIRREEVSHFGRYEVTLKAARGAGVVTGFFTYTGPHYGTRHDEIDIEFLGKNTRQMHVAWFVDGTLNNKFIDLDFDAADAFHSYAFEWNKDRIQWFADDALVFEIQAKDSPLPTVPSRLFANIWAADHSISQWSGKTNRDLKARAEISCIAFVSDTNQTSKTCTGTGDFLSQNTAFSTKTPRS
ncbi:MAG: family 16 glycosylhydrolase [Pseudoruegeria sp.]